MTLEEAMAAMKNGESVQADGESHHIEAITVFANGDELAKLDTGTYVELINLSQRLP